MNWVAAVVAVGGDEATAREYGADLTRRYAEPHRRYHTAEHIAAVLRAADLLADAVGLGHRDRALVTLAAWAHDVVYDARPGDDERASATWARSALDAARVGPADIARVEQLVLFTADHRAPDDDAAAAVLLDADLAVLGSAPAEYDAYAAAVRAEYADVPEHQWRLGRAHVLDQLLGTAALYRTPAARARWEQQAQLNLRRELATLRR